MSATDRPSTPSDVKRQLRQEAGFGCCFCGHPFVQYHHIVPWAEDQHFRPEDMMIVCGQCHPLCTVGAYTLEDQRASKARPKNIVDGITRGRLFVTSKNLTVYIAGGYARNTERLIDIRDNTVLSARLSPDDGRVLVSALIVDENGGTIATLTDNDWDMTPGNVWDFEAHARDAAVRTAHGKIAFAIDTRKDCINVRGRWYMDGQPLDFSPEQLKWGSNRMMGAISDNCGGHIRFR